MGNSIIQFLKAPHFPEDEEKTRQARALNTLHLNMGDPEHPLIEIGAQGHDPSGEPIFFMRDNGMGIAPEYHERIFRLVDKLDPNSEGTGVGLALVKRIVEFHGGRIWIQSELRKGSTFFFTLGSMEGEPGR